MQNRRTKLVFRQLRNASLNYNLIENNDRIAVGISGGKDSLLMLYLLQLLKKYTPLDFTMHPILLDLGWKIDTAAIRDYCQAHGTQLHIERTNIGQVVFDYRKEKNPCSLCSHLRRGALNRTAKSLGCNKLALGHHADDVVNTLFISLLFEGHYNVFKPSTYLDRIDLTVIRPMIYISERDITLLGQLINIPIIDKSCPADGNTKRDQVASLLEEIDQKFPGARRKLLGSIENVNPECFWSKAPQP
ncbi:MAG: tRNA 2-thiocytidine(32) synthetase TtcA [Syntrophomonadaceae bacterium]|jgi:tRNA(Ile)-lysidine synthase TilS/MesJ|nr:tRNA 2-thiocytidine(32) synthetase TtcA [Syntrophomonadaceae bacterium]